MGTCLSLCFKEEQDQLGESDPTTRLIRVEEDVDYNNDSNESNDSNSACSALTLNSEEVDSCSCMCYTCNNTTMYCYRRGNQICSNRFKTL